MGDNVLKYLQIGLEGGFTSGSTSVYNGGSAVAATRRLALEESGSDFDYPDLVWEAPDEARGAYAAVSAHHLQMRMQKGKFSSLIYADDLVYWMKMGVSGAPTVATLPSTPNTLLAATTISTSNTALTKQPNDASFSGALAQKIALTLANAAPNTTSVSFTVTGQDISGNAITETIAFSAGTTSVSNVGGGAGANSCTLYTQNYFATVSNFTASTTVAGDTIALGGIFAFLYTGTPDMTTSSLKSGTGEWFDGSTPWQMPGMVLPKLDFTLTVGKSAKMKGDTLARDIIPLSNMTALVDKVWPAITTLDMRYFSDPIGSIPGTTQVNARLLDATFGIDNQLTLGKAADGTPLPSFVGRKKYKTKAELTLLFNSGVALSEDPSDYAAYARTYQSRTIRVACVSDAYLPCGPFTVSGNNWPAALVDQNGKGGLYGMMIDHAGKFTVGKPVDHEGRLAVKLTHDMEVDYTKLNAPYVLTVISRLSPND